MIRKKEDKTSIRKKKQHTTLFLDTSNKPQPLLLLLPLSLITQYKNKPTSRKQRKEKKKREKKKF
jgi:hypothetical protein